MLKITSLEPTAVDVGGWLRDLGLEIYEAAFRENGVNDEVLRHLTADDLKELGVSAVGHRRQILVAIARLLDDAVPPPSDSASEDCPRPPLAAERRQITVLFCDIVGSTTLSTGLDPEELREVLSAYQVKVASAVTGKRGYIARFVGDGVLAYFGWPNADEAHAESAVRAALEIVETVGSQQLAVRIGIATGLVVTGDLVGVGAAQSMTAVGETPNLAARLQSLARPDTVVVSEATCAQLGQMFELQDLGSQVLKGFDKPVGASRVRGRTGALSRSETIYASAPRSLVGRDEELGLLLRRWHEAKTSGGRVMLLSGEGGIGKSRLLAALEERLAGELHVNLRYFCSPHYQNSPLFPLIARLERDAGFARGDTAAERLAKLETILAPSEPPPEDVALFASLLSIPADGGYALPEISPQQRKIRTVGAVSRWLSWLANKRPVLMLFEDAHWSDPSSIELLDAVIEHVPTLPILLVVSFRPEFVAPWFGRPRVGLIALGRLARRDAAILATQVGTDRALSPELQEQIVARAEGVPLFIEELTKAIVENKLPEQGVAAPHASADIPASLYDSLLARLDRLQGGRELAQIGAVIGREFSHEMLSEVAGQPPASLSASLEELVRSELVFRIGTPPDARYTFNHVLVQQATYETLLRSRRKDLHARVANAIVRLQRDDTDPLLLHHATLADDHELVARACKAAGDRSLRIFAHEEAYRLAERGLVHLGHLPDGERKVRFQIGLLSIKVHAAYKYRDEIPNLLVRLEEAADVAITLGLHNEAVAAFYAKAWLQQWSNDTRGASETVLRAEETSRKADEMTRCYQVANTGRCLLEVELQIPRALAMVDEAETMSQRLNLHFVELEWARAHAARWTGDLDRAHALLTRAVDLARLREERWRQVECIIWLAMIELERRNLQSVERYCDEIDEIAERLEHALPPVAAAFRVLARTGSRHRDLLPTIGQALTALRDFDDKAHLAYVLNFSAQDALAEGQVAWASCAAHEALTAAGAMSLTTETVVAASILARIACADGDREAAAARIQALVSECEPETLSARAKASLEQAAQHAGLDLKLPPTNIVA